MRPLFRGEGCAVNEAGISAAGNPLSRMFDAATNDAMGAQQMREGYLAGVRPGMRPMMRPDMMRPMMGKPGGSMDDAWNDVRPMGPGPMPRGPMLGDAMAEQFMQHMGPRPPGMAQEAGFFTDGPMSMSHGPGMGDDWAAEFGAGPAGPRGLLRPPPPGMTMMRPPGADWAGEFAAQRHVGPDPHMEMEAAFHQAQMEKAFAEAAGPRPMGPGDPMEAAFAEAMNLGPPDMEAAFAEAQMEAAFAEAQQETMQAQSSEQADLSQAAQMVEMLRNSGNPKFANSQFVSFIDKVSKGDLQFKENTVIDREGNEVDWDSLYDTSAATASDSERNALEKMWEASASPEQMDSAWQAAASSNQMASAWQAAATPEQMEARMESIFKDAASKEDFMSEMESMWKASADSGQANPQQFYEDLWKMAENEGGPDMEALERMWAHSREGMENAWNLAGEDPEAALLEHAWMGEDSMENIWRHGAGRNKEYEFQEDNAYRDMDDPLAEAQRLLREGRDREALMALEAEVQRNPESSEGWRQLGQLYAELDQDVEAIQCLRRGHEVDPYNLDSLLALGVSCTNELDQLPALRYLRRWIENHEDHSVLLDGLEPPPDYEYEAWRRQVTMLFNGAAEANPLDADVFVALGVMENINRNYDAAIQALAAACRLRPNDHTCWNKLGATLANSGKSEQAVVAYHQGLTLKPNYARSWSNLAIAHANLGQHADAARFYLSSLVLNPDATHIWSFLHSAVLNMGSTDAFEAIDKRDLSACTRIIDGVLEPDKLPKPSEELSQTPDEILASIGL